MTVIDSAIRPISAPPARYALAVRWLHWSSALIILWAMFSGMYAATLDVTSSVRAEISGFNVALTALFIPVFLIRIVVRVVFRDPEPIAVSRPQQRLIEVAHLTLYATVMVVLATGVLTVGHPASIFGLMTLDPIPMSDAGRHLAERVHRWSCYALLCLVILHVGAVVAHRLAGRKIYRRMAL